MEEHSTNGSTCLSIIDNAIATRLAYFDLLLTVLMQHEKKLDDLIQQLSNVNQSSLTISDRKPSESHMVPLTCMIQT